MATALGMEVAAVEEEAAGAGVSHGIRTRCKRTNRSSLPSSSQSPFRLIPSVRLRKRWYVGERDCSVTSH